MNVASKEELQVMEINDISNIIIATRRVIVKHN